MFSEIIQTERLILRPFNESDIQASFEMENDPEVVKYTHDGGVKSLEQITKLIKTVIEVDYREIGFGRFAVELKETGEFIGFCGLKYLADIDKVDLGYRLKQKHWGKGYATEASKASIKFGFEQLNLKEILAYALVRNSRSIHLLEKLNFKKEKEFEEENERICQYVLQYDW